LGSDVSPASGFPLLVLLMFGQQQGEKGLDGRLNSVYVPN
jgi:hypothetical protein